MPGVNLFIGENGTGKTHILKLLYAAQAADVKGFILRDISGKILRVFLPRELSVNRLVKKDKGSKKDTSFSITMDGKNLSDQLDVRIRTNCPTA